MAKEGKERAVKMALLVEGDLTFKWEQRKKAEDCTQHTKCNYAKGPGERKAFKAHADARYVN